MAENTWFYAPTEAKLQAGATWGYMGRDLSPAGLAVGDVRARKVCQGVLGIWGRQRQITWGALPPCRLREESQSHLKWVKATTKQVPWDQTMLQGGTLPSEHSEPRTQEHVQHQHCGFQSKKGKGEHGSVGSQGVSSMGHSQYSSIYFKGPGRCVKHRVRCGENRSLMPGGRGTPDNQIFLAVMVTLHQ